AGFFARHGELAEDLADYFSEFDLIVSYLYDPDQIFEMNVRRCTEAQFIAGPHRPDEAAGLPAARVFLKPLERLAIFDEDFVPALKVGQAFRPPPNPGAGQSRAQSELAQVVPTELPGDSQSARPILAVHPGSGSERKNWPENKWVELLQALTDSTKL